MAGSGRQGLNLRNPSAWQADALPTELRPHKFGAGGVNRTPDACAPVYKTGPVPLRNASLKLNYTISKQKLKLY